MEYARKQIPTAKVILHIDRDQKVEGDRELERLKEDCRQRDIALFVTKYQEIESYFCTPMHIHKIYGISLEQAELEYERIIDSLKEEALRKLANFVLRDRQELGKNKSGQMDISVTQEVANRWYGEYRVELTPGKELLGAVKKYVQEVLRGDPNKIVGYSDALLAEEFRVLIVN